MYPIQRGNMTVNRLVLLGALGALGLTSFLTVSFFLGVTMLRRLRRGRVTLSFCLLLGRTFLYGTSILLRRVKDGFIFSVTTFAFFRRVGRTPRGKSEVRWWLDIPKRCWARFSVTNSSIFNIRTQGGFEYGLLTWCGKQVHIPFTDIATMSNCQILNGANQTYYASHELGVGGLASFENLSSCFCSQLSE
jgi:hypothetical protein